MKRYLLILSFFTITTSNAFATIIHVNVNVQGGNNDGTDWPNAFSKLQDALLTADYGDTIWVASGTYFPTSSTNRHFYFDLKNGVRMFGGFIGNETLLTQRDWNANQTILSGDIGVQGDSTDNCYTVVNCGFVDSTTVLDGFVVTGGNADSQAQFEPVTGRTKSGGGIYILGTTALQESRPFIMNCTLFRNYARYYGGGIYCRSNLSGNVSPIIKDCLFKQNAAGTGAGLYLGGTGLQNIVSLENCSFVGNIANFGGGIYCQNDTGTKNVMINSCTFFNNISNLDGGGVGIENSNSLSSLTILNCDFIENSADGGGSAISCFNYIETQAPTIINCNFKNNYSNDGTIFLFDGSSIEIVGSSFKRNTGDAPGLFFGGINCKIKNCQFLDSESTDTLDKSPIIFISGSGTEDTNDFINCNFSGNKMYGSPIFYCYPTQITSLNNIINTIIYDNGIGTVGTPIEVNNSEFYISHSLIDVPNCATIADKPITCEPNILYNLPPLFLDTAAGDFRLSPCSPARNAGSNAIVDSLGILTDLAGSPRIQGGTVDMGAFESPAFQATSATVTSQPCPTGASNGAGDGTVVLTLENGCPPFFLNWGTGSMVSDTSLALIALPIGIHSVTVTDGRMESDTVTVTLTAAPAITGSATANPANCVTGTGGTASIEAVGGTGALSFSWTSTGAGNVGTTATINNLPVGNYQVTVTDANGCTLVDSVTVGTVGSLTLGLSVHPITCAGDSDGWATVQPLGGTMPFQWLWQNGPTTPTIDSLSGGTYLVTVTDALGCTGATNFTMNPPTAVSISISAMNPLCFGKMGTAIATATGGTGSFQYAWSNGATTASTMLPAGQHTVTATDAHGCTGTDNVTITSPPVLTVNLTPEPPTLCFDDSNGVLNVTANGGTPPYGWGGPLENLPAGNYMVTITDSNACTAVGQATIAEHPEITVADTVADASSPTAADGGITLTSVTGGTGSGYTFLWDNGAASQNLTNLPTGDYTVTVTDSQGCTASFSFFVDFNSAAGEAGANPFGAVIVPNPSGRGGARLVFEELSQDIRLKIFDASSKLVFAEQIQSTNYILPKDFAVGRYQVWLQAEKKQMVLIWVVAE